MQLSEFQASLEQNAPPTGLSFALESLWYAGKGDWDLAHDLTQPGGSALDWVHAYLHRVEGDFANAGYWYRRAGKPVATTPLEDEWVALVETFLNAS